MISAPRYPTESIPLPVISRIGQLERGPHESDDHAYADKQIGENDGGAIIDARGPSVGRTASPVQCTKLVFNVCPRNRLSEPRCCAERGLRLTISFAKNCEFLRGGFVPRSVCVALVAIVALGASRSAKAQPTIDVTKVNCDQFVHHKISE